MSSKKGIYFEYPKIFTPDSSLSSIKHKSPDKADCIGTIKLHGTCSGVLFDGINIYAQSKDGQVISPEGHFGFGGFVDKRKHVFYKFFNHLVQKYEIDISKSNIVIYGEFCGSNIQKNDSVAISKLSKRFVIFDAVVCDNNRTKLQKWLKINDMFDDQLDIYNIYNFPTYHISIDFSSADTIEIARKQIESYVHEVDQQCPFSKHFGITGNGEGIVWRHWYDDYHYVAFKTKGETHKVKLEKQLVQFYQDDVTTIQEYCDRYVTPQRIESIISKKYDGIVPKINEIMNITNAVFHDINSEESQYIKCDVVLIIQKIKEIIMKQLFPQNIKK